MADLENNDRASAIALLSRLKKEGASLASALVIQTLGGTPWK